MRWIVNLFRKLMSHTPRPGRPKNRFRPGIEKLERREVPAASPVTFQLQANGDLLQFGSGGLIQVADMNVTTFGVVQNSAGQVTLIDLHQNGQVMERDPSGNWSTVNAFVKSLSVFGDSSGNGQVEMLGQNGSLIQVTLPSGAWKTIAPIGVTWMQGVAGSQGSLARLYWLNTIGQLWQMLASGQQSLVASSVASVSLDSQGNPRIVYQASGGSSAAPTQAASDPIQIYWNQLGQPAWLGTPTSGELQTPNGQGYYELFTNGAIYWTPQTGAHEMHGAIYQRWLAGGGESYLGDPTTDTQIAADGSGNTGDLLQQFQKGAIYVKAASTPVVLSGSAYTSLLTVTNQLPDAGVRQMTLTLVVADGQLTRTDMIKVLHLVETGGVTATEFSSLQQIIASAATLNMPASVQVLAGKVVNGNSANSTYQGAPLGNLTVGASPTLLDKLINKWFYGTDEPSSGGYSYKLVSGSLFGPSGQPQYQQIMQGVVGDCYLLAALGTMALQDPQAIRAMITDNHDGLTATNDTYTVRFWNPGSSSWDYVTVDSMLPVASWGLAYAGMGSNPSSTSNALWVPLIEKAYAEMAQEGWLNRPALNSYQNLNNGYTYQALTQLTGQTASYSSLTTPQAIASFFAKGGMVVLDTSSYPFDLRVVPSHSYVVTGCSYNSITGTYTFTLFNPWGVNGGYQGNLFMPGTLTMNWNQIMQNFQSWNWESPV